MYRIIVIVILFILQAAVSYASPPEITAKSAVVIEATTGKVLFAKDAEVRRYPASTTKIMTLIVALEKGNVNDVVTASENAANTEGSTLWLTAGEQLKLLDMLYGMMLVSGNDATVAIAEHIAGSVEEYAKLMTEKAHEIGAADTNFTNTSGLPDPNHYTTARDLGRIAAYGYRNPLFAEIVSTKHKTMPWAGKDHERDLYNENRMLTLYEGGNGVKTGYTEAAGRCLVSGAKRGDVQLVAVVLDSDHMWEDSMTILDYGFQQVKSTTIFKKGDILKTARVLNGKTDSVKLLANSDLIVPVFDTGGQVTAAVDAPDVIEAQLIAGQKVGTVHVVYQNKEVGSVDLVSADTVERKSFFGMLWGGVWNVFTYILRNFA